MPLAHSLSLRVLTCPRCALQGVSAPRSLTFFSCANLSSRCALQEVSAPTLAFFPCPHSSLPMRAPGSESPPRLAVFPCPHLFLSMLSRSHLPLPIHSLARECTSCTHLLSLHVLTCPSQYALQTVSHPRLLGFFRALSCPSRYALQRVSALRSFVSFSCPHLTLPVLSLGCECTLFACFLSCPHLSFPMRSPARECPRSLTFVSCHHLSLLMRSLGSECPPFACFLSVSSLVPPAVLSRE